MGPFTIQPPTRWRRFLLAAALTAGLLAFVFAFQGSRGIYSPDEGFYVGIAQGMLETGDYLVPRLQDEPWLDKPPLSLWGIAAGLRLLGLNEWGARAFHALCFASTILLVFLLGRSIGSARDGRLAAFFYATMPIPFAAASITTPDAPLALCTTASFFCFWQSARPAARHAGPWKLLLCASFGLGFLTKGPAALVPSAAMFVFLLAQRRVFRYFLTPWFAAGAALFLALGFGWYACVAHEVPGSLAYFLDNQLVGRTVSSKYDRNPGLLGALIYLPVVLAGTLPWSVVWWTSLRGRGRQLLRPPFWAALLGRPEHLFLLSWAVVPLLILGLVSSKLPLYALPVFPALALLTARRWPLPPPGAPRVGPPPGIARTQAILFTSWLLLLLAAKLAYSAFPMREDMRALAAAIRGLLPRGPYEIVSVEDHLESLSLYDIEHVERVSFLPHPYPFFVLPAPLSDKIAGMPSPDRAQLFVCREAWQKQVVRSSLRSAAVPFQEIEIPFFRTAVFVCPASGHSPRTVRLVAVSEPGTRRNRRQSVASALHLLDVKAHLNGGVLLLAEPRAWGIQGPGGPADRRLPGFERTFADLLANRVPFYTVAGAGPAAPGASPGDAARAVLLGEGLVELCFPAVAAPGPVPGPGGALWKVVALPPPPAAGARGAAPGDSWMEGAGAQVLLREDRCLLAAADPPPPLPITGPDPAVAYRLFEFRPSDCTVTSFDLVGRPLASCTVPRTPHGR